MINKQPETFTNLPSKLDGFQTGIYEPFKEIVEHDQEGNITQEELLQVKNHYVKKYLNLIHQQLAGKP